jgi:purine-binding chemotaxis protein CheW
MSDGPLATTSRAQAMRQAFDASFAQPAQGRADAVEALLAITVGGDPYVLRLAEIAGLHASRAITTLPSPVPELAGLVGLRSALVPVYDLAALLGYPRAAAPRWLVVLAAAPVALAFEGFAGYVTAAATTVVVEASADDDEPIRDIVRARHLVRPVLGLTPVLERIRRRASRARPDKERQ